MPSEDEKPNMPTQPPRYVRISRKAQRSQPEPLPLPAHLGERPAATPQPPSPRGQRQRQGQAQTAAGKREPTVLRTPQPNGAGPGGGGTPAAGGAEQHGSHGPSRSSRQRGARGTERNGTGTARCTSAASAAAAQPQPLVPPQEGPARLSPTGVTEPEAAAAVIITGMSGRVRAAGPGKAKQRETG